jgi:hypothetical protein
MSKVRGGREMKFYVEMVPSGWQILQVSDRILDRMAAKNWPARRLEEIADIAGGVALGGALPAGVCVILPYLRVANVQDGFIDPRT